MGLYGGPAGDLYVGVRIKPHPQLIRRGQDIIFEAEITYPQAALGAEITVPIIGGESKLKIPSGTQNGAILRMRGLGMPSRFGKGDQLVHVTVKVPQKLNTRQRELLEQLNKEFSSEQKKGWFNI